MLSPFTMPVAEDLTDEKLLSDIEEVGWHAVHIFAEEGSPEFTFTVGLYYQYEHPELLVMGLPKLTAHVLLTRAAELIGQGSRFEPGQLYSGIADISLAVVPVNLSCYQEYLGYGIWFYQSLPKPFPAIQLVWPDKSGLFPWQDGYEVGFQNLQKLLNRAL